MIVCSVLLKELTDFVVVQQIFDGLMSKTVPLMLKKKKGTCMQARLKEREKGPQSLRSSPHEGGF